MPAPPPSGGIPRDPLPSRMPHRRVDKKCAAGGCNRQERARQPERRMARQSTIDENALLFALLFILVLLAILSALSRCSRRARRRPVSAAPETPGRSRCRAGRAGWNARAEDSGTGRAGGWG